MLTVKDLQQYTQELSKKITFNTENLYIHYINCRGGHYTTKINIVIVDNNAFDLTQTQLHNFIKTNFTLTQSNFQGNGNGLSCTGFAANNVEANIKNIFAIAWLSDQNAFAVLKDTDGALPDVYVLPELTINNQKTITLALNNVLRPSMKEYDTKLSLGGTQESSANIHWVCLKTPMPNGKFLYKWTGHYLQTKSVAITTGYGSNFMSGKFALEVPDTRIITKAIISARQSSSTAWIAGSYGGSSLDFYMLRATSATINNSLEINIQAEYIDS